MTHRLSGVGIGQTLKMDHKRDRLVLAGLITNSSGGSSHQILTAPLGGGGRYARRSGADPKECATFTKAGTFGIADQAPMLHSSAYDEAAQTLYVTVSPNKTAFALATINLATKTLVSVDIESGADQINGMSWDPDSSSLIGMGQAQTGPELVSLDPATGKWTVRPLTNAGTGPPWEVLGNEGDVHNYDPSTGANRPIS